MDKKSKQPEQVKNKDSHNLSFLDKNYRREIKAAERSHHRPDADPGKTSGTEHKTSDKVQIIHKGRSSSQLQHRGSGQDRSSSRSGTLHVRQSWPLTKEIPITPKSAEGSSKPGTNKRTSLTPLKGGFIGSHVHIDNKGGTVIYKSDGVRISGHNKNDDSDSHPQE